MFIQTLAIASTVKVRTGWPYRWFWKFFHGLRLKPTRASIVLNSNLYRNIVKYCILLSEVCMIKTVPHSIVSPEIWWMYKWYKRLVYMHPDLLARYCKINLSNAKNSVGIFFPGLIYLRWSRAIMALNKCDRGWLPVLGCPYKAINSMWDLVHSWAVCKLFFVKSLSLFLKSQTNVL